MSLNKSVALQIKPQVGYEHVFLGRCIFNERRDERLTVEQHFIRKNCELSFLNMLKSLRLMYLRCARWGFMVFSVVGGSSTTKTYRAMKSLAIHQTSLIDRQNSGKTTWTWVMHS